MKIRMALRYAIMTLRAKTTPKTTNQTAKANKENFCMIPLGNRNNTTPERVENIIHEMICVHTRPFGNVKNYQANIINAELNRE